MAVFVAAVVVTVALFNVDIDVSVVVAAVIVATALLLRGLVVKGMVIVVLWLLLVLLTVVVVVVVEECDGGSGHVNGCGGGRIRCNVGSGSDVCGSGSCRSSVGESVALSGWWWWCHAGGW